MIGREKMEQNLEEKQEKYRYKRSNKEAEGQDFNQSRRTRPKEDINKMMMQNETHIFVIIALIHSYIVQKPFVRVRQNCTERTRLGIS